MVETETCVGIGGNALEELTTRVGELNTELRQLRQDLAKARGDVAQARRDATPTKQKDHGGVARALSPSASSAVFTAISTAWAFLINASI